MSDARPIARRFYRETSVETEPDGFGVRLDARRLRTPGGAVFAAPTRALAERIAEEWGAQGEQVIPATMPLTQLAFAAVDGGKGAREERVAYIAAHAETDLCCHRAEAPAALVADQAKTWDPLVAWGADALGAELPVVTGVIPAVTSARARTALRAATEQIDDFSLTALAQAVAVTGSALIGWALLRGRVGAQDAFEAAMLDDLWNQARWGEDPQAQARLLRVRRELEALERFIAALASNS